MARPVNPRDERLSIYILMDLGVKTKDGVSWTYSRNDRALRIHALGCSRETFPFLCDDLDIVSTLNDILQFSAVTDPSISEIDKTGVCLFYKDNCDSW